MSESLTLAPEPLRVLGALMEKEMTTPENYPLSLNALIAACNQKTSREPVTNLSEDQVRSALDTLEIHELISTAHDARVPKYEHRIRTVLNLRRDETAVLCLLILRGPQTTGELRGRSDRMFTFDDTGQVQSTLDRLAAREIPLTAILPRLPGSSASLWMHLLGGPAPAFTANRRPHAKPRRTLRSPPADRRFTAARKRFGSPFRDSRKLLTLPFVCHSAAKRRNLRLSWS